jgi:hypothetical protein
VLVRFGLDFILCAFFIKSPLSDNTVRCGRFHRKEILPARARVPAAPAEASSREGPGSMNSSPIRRRVRRAFIANPMRSTGDLVRCCWPRRNRFYPMQYFRVRTAARVRGPGRPRSSRSVLEGDRGTIWKAREPLPQLPELVEAPYTGAPRSRQRARVRELEMRVSDT